MAGVDVGGDESVMWTARGDNVRKDLSLKHEKHGDFGWLHSGVDEAEGDFTIKIKIPNDRAGLFQRMRDAVTASEQDSSSMGVTFTLPIEFGQHKQIQISWDSDLSSPHGSRRASATSLKSRAISKRKPARSVTARKSKTKTASRSTKKTSKRK